MKIALALLVLTAVVVVLVSRQARIAEAIALAEAPALPAKRPSPAPPSRPRPAPPSLAEAPIGRALPPAPAAPAPSSTTLGGPKTTSATAQAEQMGPPAPRTRLLPRPVAIDNATFAVGVSRIRLLGVEPMAISETCGMADTPWRCGIMARTALRGWLRSRSISCSVPDDLEKRRMTVSARCTIGQEDVALWLVDKGWARPTATGAYVAAGAKARDAGRGIWAPGSPVAP